MMPDIMAKSTSKYQEWRVMCSMRNLQKDVNDKEKR